MLLYPAITISKIRRIINKNQENQLSPLTFEPKLTLCSLLLCQLNVSKSSNYHLLLDTNASYQYVQNETNRIKQLQQNWWRPLLGHILSPKWPFSGPTNFFQSWDHHHLLNIINIYHNMQNRHLKLMHFNQENGLKPHLGPFLALIGPFLSQQIIFQYSDHHHLLNILNIYYT